VIKAIVNIASTSWAPPDSALHPHDAAAKAGIVAFTRSVALQLAPTT
jgi:NAD(P)-dependent dehydrogenase (short-subunit alcohol dehydrogenase family)